MSGVRWSLAEDETLCAMFAEGATDAAIGAAVGRPSWSVTKRRQKLRIKRHFGTVGESWTTMGGSDKGVPRSALQAEPVVSEWCTLADGTMVRTVRVP